MNDLNNNKVTDFSDTRAKAAWSSAQTGVLVCNEVLARNPRRRLYSNRKGKLSRKETWSFQVQGPWLPIMNDLNNNKVTDFSDTRAKAASSSAQTGVLVCNEVLPRRRLYSNKKGKVSRSEEGGRKREKLDYVGKNWKVAKVRITYHTYVDAMYLILCFDAVGSDRDKRLLFLY